MDRNQAIESILKAVKEDITQFLDVHDQIDSSIEYEERVLEISRRFARNLISRSAGNWPKSRNAKKKVLTTFGRVEVKKVHVLCKCTEKFRISERMQGLMCLLGQSMVFEDGEEIFEKTLDLDISAKQIQRVSEYYGSALDPLIKANCEAVIPTLETKQKDEAVYVMMDGSMVCTRGKQRWHEMKLGRIFYDSQTIDIQQNRREITRSVYVSHFGSADNSKTSTVFDAV